MRSMPVIVGFGGVGAAGRSSSHHAFRRTVFDALDGGLQESTLRSLQGLASVDDGPAAREELLAGSLVRRIEPRFFDPDSALWNRRLRVEAPTEPLAFRVPRTDRPTALQKGWNATPAADGSRAVDVEITDATEILVRDARPLGVSSAGMVPTGFEPGKLYPARSHPRALELTVFAASDTVRSLGVDWEEVQRRVGPAQISTYAGSAMSQLDDNGNGGLMNARHRGRRITSKHVPMGLGEMAADFTNAYVLGSVGQTGHNMGACATFLYNLRLGVQDIREGRSRVAVVGGVEAPLEPDVMDGLVTMGALATDKGLRQVEGLEADGTPDFRRACRPFGENCGFVMGEGAQFAILMDEELALELGAVIYGGVGDVFVHADGHKKSISSPGVGNYVTFARAVADAARCVGDDVLRSKSFVHAHGTGTPQNRTSESAIFDAVADAFGIRDWPVAAVKCFVGHTMAAAGGDQLVSSLGTFADHVVPGVATIDEPADDVSQAYLEISSGARQRDERGFEVAFLNAKGFGGNNATGWVEAPWRVLERIEHSHGSAAVHAWRDKLEATEERVASYDAAACGGDFDVIYRFDHGVRDGRHVRVERERLTIEGVGEIEL